MSNVTPKTDSEIEGMREAGRLAAEVLELISPQVEVGMTTGELDRICHDHIVNVQKAIPAPLNYKGFPKSICTSVNEVICHGIPSDQKKLRNGDIINIDVTVIKDGWHGDTSIMVGVGEVAPHAERLVRITQECLYHALALVRPGAKLGDLGHVIQQHAEANYYSVVREYCGHGIGQVFHEEPQVLHYGKPGTGLHLRAGHDIHGRAHDQCGQAIHEAQRTGRMDCHNPRRSTIGPVGTHHRRHRIGLRSTHPEAG